MKKFSVEQARHLRKEKQYEDYFAYCSAFADDPEAQAHLAVCYYNGFGVEADDAQVFHYDSLSAAQDCAAGLAGLGFDYLKGIGVAADVAAALPLLERAAARDVPLALRLLGDLRADGCGLAQDQTKAAAYYQRAAELGDAAAMYRLAGCYRQGSGVRQDLAAAAEWYAQATEAGHAQAACALALCYDNGDGVACDPQEAVRLYALSAARGYDFANYYLALSYEEGRGVQQDLCKAATLYDTLAEDGYVAAYARRGLMLAEGRGTRQDTAQAQTLLATCTEYTSLFDEDELAEIWRVLADCRHAQGDAEGAATAEDEALALYTARADMDESGAADYWAGKLLSARGQDKDAFRHWERALLCGWRPAVLRVAQAYEHGRGVARDKEKAYAILKAQAEQGDYYYRVLQAVHLEYGVGVPQDMAQAATIYRACAASTNALARRTAQFCLGACALHGRGMAQDTAQARTLLEESGEEMAKYFLAFLDDPSAENCYALALIYQYDFYYIKPAPELAYHYAQAACDRDPQPQHLSMLAQLVLRGRGAARDLDRAYALYERAGDARAEQALGEFRYYGVTVPQDDAAAVRAFAGGVQRQEPRAMLYLGLCYLHGRGVAADAAQALALLQRAAASRGYYARYAEGLAALLVLSQPALGGDATAARASLAQLGETPSFWTQIDRFYSAAPTQELAEIFLSLVETKLSERYLKRSPLAAYAKATAHVYQLVRQYSKRATGQPEQDVQALQDEIARLQQALAQSQTESESKDTLLAERAQSIAALSEDIAFYRDVLSRGVATVEQKVDRIDTRTQALQLALDALSQTIDSEVVSQLRTAKETLAAQLATAPAAEQDALTDAMCRAMNDAINAAMAHASDAIVRQEEAHLARLFGDNWLKLLPLSRASIVSASVLWQGCAGITMADFDYSGICISVTTALEAELRRVFFDGFGDYLTARYGAPETLPPETVFTIWPEKLLTMTQREYARAKKPKLRRQTTFTIGNLPFLLGERRERFASADQQALVQQRADEYLATIVRPQFASQARQAFTHAHSGESFVDKCERIRVEYRNDAAHAKVVSRAHAIACYHAVIGRIDAYDHINDVTSALLTLYAILR